jgi:hypothetical protein
VTAEEIPASAPQSSQFLLLNGERQYDYIAGKYLPAVEPVKVPVEVPEKENTSLPLFNLVRQMGIHFPKPHGIHRNGECSNGYFVKVCQHIQEKDVTVGKVYCHRQDCEVSQHRNSNVRFNSLFYGKRDSLDNETGEIEKLGIAKLAENFDTIWVVFTLPKHLHHLLASVDYLQKWHKACYRVIRFMLEKNGIPANDKATLVPIKQYFHPNGDKAPSVYLPHLNYGIINCFYRNGKLFAGKRYFSKKWFTEGTFREAYLEEVNKEFGFNIWEGMEEKQLDMHVEIRKRENPAEVIHSWGYFSRIFPSFTRLHEGKRFLPKSLGLLSPRNTGKLKEVLRNLPEIERLRPSCGQGTIEKPCEFRVLNSVTEEGVKIAMRLFRSGGLSGWVQVNNLNKVAHKTTADPPVDAQPPPLLPNTG